MRVTRGRAVPGIAAFIRPIFLTVMIVRFHTLVQNQRINQECDAQECDARLASISDKFRDWGMRAPVSQV